MSALIQPNGCKNCKHKYAKPDGSGLLCKQSPPVPHPVLVMDQAGNIQVKATMSMWPEVQPDWMCGQHAPAIALARALAS